MVKVKPNTLYKYNGLHSCYLYVRKDMTVGFGWSEKDARTSPGDHSHWIEDGNVFLDGIVIVKTDNLSLWRINNGKNAGSS